MGKPVDLFSAIGEAGLLPWLTRGTQILLVLASALGLAVVGFSPNLSATYVFTVVVGTMAGVTFGAPFVMRMKSIFEVGTTGAIYTILPFVMGYLLVWFIMMISPLLRREYALN
ncbi:MAG: hypothetical protein HYT39_01620 [Candidatus Sungbacteria bacterium]|nr:hypothetical protein [Candidatus Sungbacteria bacterium]